MSSDIPVAADAPSVDAGASPSPDPTTDAPPTTETTTTDAPAERTIEQLAADYDAALAASESGANAEQNAEPSSEGEKPAEEPKPEDEALRFSSLARLQSKVSRAQREIKSEKARLHEARQEIERERAHWAEQRRLLHEAPDQFLERNQISPDHFAKWLGLAPTEHMLKQREAESAAQEMAQLRAEVMAMKQAEVQRRAAAERAYYQQQVDSAVSEFERFALSDENAQRWPALATMLEANETTREEALNEWLRMQRVASNSQWSYGPDEIAETLNEIAERTVGKMATAYTTRKNGKQKGAPTKSGSGVPQTLTSRAAAERSSASAPVELAKMSDAEQMAYYAREYEREVARRSKGGR